MKCDEDFKAFVFLARISVGSSPSTSDYIRREFEIFWYLQCEKKTLERTRFQPIALFQFPSSSSFIKSISKYTLSLIKCLLQQIDNSIVVTSQSHQNFSCLRALFQDEIINIHFCGAPVRHLLNAFLGFPKQGLGGMRDPPKNGQIWVVETV